MLCNAPKVKINLRLGAFGTSLHPTESPTKPFYFKCDIMTFQSGIIKVFVVEFKMLTPSIITGQVYGKF